MAIKPNGHTCWIREQIIEDLPSGLTRRLEALPGGRCEIAFDREGRVLGSERR